jgi:adenylate kinase
MLNLVIFGPPGAGKGTQSAKLVEKYGLAHISTGDVLRSEMERGTPNGVTAKGFINNGKLVPDELIIGMLEDKLKNLTDTSGVIFDGFPRTTIQAEALKQMLTKLGTGIAVMLCITVEDEELIQRLLQRGAQCGRSDDNLETINKRIVVYNTQTAPVFDFYNQEGVAVTIDGSRDIDTVFADLCSAVDSRI